jgi:hypothetical protein
MFLLCSATLSNVTYAQIFPNTQSPSTPGNRAISQQQQQPPSQPKLHLVKITSPHKGQQVPVGKDLIVSGTSANNGTSTCKVSVKVNGINPYHDALPSGPGGQNDYSKWSFTLTPAYTTIKQGQNKMIAKFACTDNPSLLSKTSLNVTGVTGGATADGNSSATAGSGFPSPNASGLSASNNTLTSQATSGSAHHAASDGSGSSAGKIINESKHSKIIK